MKSPLLKVLPLVLITAMAGTAGWKQSRSKREEVRSASGEGSVAMHGPAGSALGGTEADASAVAKWAARLAATDAAGLPAMAEEALAVADQPKSQKWMRLLAARWAEVDPAGGVAFFADQQKGKPSHEANPWPQIWILTEWALRDVEAAWAHVAAQNGKDESGVVINLGAELLRENPRVFWDWFLKAREPLPRQWGDPNPAWLELARQHGKTLEAMAAEMAAAPKDQDSHFNSPKYVGLYALLAAVKAESDPGAALDWAKSVPEDVRNQCLRTILPLLAKSDPEAARKALDDMKSKQVGARSFIGSGREQVMDQIVGEIGKTDPAAALQWAVKAGGEGHDHISPIANLMRSALAEGRLTPQEAFALIQEQKSEGDGIRINVLRKMWNGLPAGAFASAAEWLRDIESADAKSWALAGLVPAWAKSDPEAAMRFAHELDDAGVRRSIFGEMLSSSTRQGAAASLPDALAIIPESDRAEVIKEHLRMHFSDRMLDDGYPALDPAIFANSLLDTPVGKARDEATKAALGRWGALDPVAAVEWAGQQPAGDLRTASLMGAVEGWAEYDAWSVSQWLAEQPRGPDRDAATHQLARSLRTQEPDSAWTWAADIADPATRLEARAAVLRSWRDLDAVAAGEAVATLPQLTPAERQKLTDTLARTDQPQ